MRARVLQLVESIRASFWFIPALMVLASTGLAFALGRIDDAFEGPGDGLLGWVYSGGPEGAREVLSTIAGSMITVAGVVFSVTIVALSLASQQFGPRMLRNFMLDRGNQVVLGTFTSLFVYSMLVLRTIRGEGESYSRNVPHLSVTAGVLLAMFALGILIYFIHHVSLSIQVDAIVSRVADELDGTIGALFADEGEPRGGVGEPREPEWTRVPAKRDGYIQAIDPKKLARAARNRGARVRMELAPGEFVFPGVTLAQVTPAEAGWDAQWVYDEVAIGEIRTPAQDPEFSIGRLVEMALRALSPSLNDPFTAMTCLDRLGAAFALAASRPLRDGTFADEDGAPRLEVPLTTLERLADASFHQIRQAAAAHPSVTMHLLSVFASVMRATRSAEAKRILRRHADLVRRGVDESRMIAADVEAIESRYREVVSAEARNAEAADGEPAAGRGVTSR